MSKKMTQFCKAVGPYTQHRITVDRQLLHEDFSARQRTCLFQEVCIKIRQIVMTEVAERSTWALNGVVAVHVIELTAHLTMTVLVLAP